MTHAGGGERRVRGLAATTVSAEWTGLQERFLWPDQELYELIRPVVLFEQPRKDRARETGVSARTLSRAVDRFVQRNIPQKALSLDQANATRNRVSSVFCRVRRE